MYFKNNKTKRFFSLLVGLILLVSLFVGCIKNENSQQVTDEVTNKTLILATTTSTRDSGLLDKILPSFTEETGIEAKVIAIGTGKAIKMGEDGEADVLLVHAKSSEEAFVRAGHGLERFDVMYNDFVLIGPKDDPASLKSNSPKDISKAFKYINDNSIQFVSRGDDSGTHKKEIGIWNTISTNPEGKWYVSAGKGMGDVILMANEMNAYTMTDRATYLNMMDKIDLKIITEGDEILFNQYGVISVNPDKNDKINAQGAQEFIKWILSDKVQSDIGDYGKEKFGQALFTPNAK